LADGLAVAADVDEVGVRRVGDERGVEVRPGGPGMDAERSRRARTVCGRSIFTQLVPPVAGARDRGELEVV